MDEYGANNTFVHHIYSGTNDYKVARLTKLVTDVTPAQMTGGSTADYKGGHRVGGGEQLLRDDKGDSDRSIQGVYLVGGIAGITDWASSTSDLRHGTVIGTTSWVPSQGAGEGTPLPFGSRGRLRQPLLFVWEGDAETGYKFLMAHRGSTDANKQTQSCEALEWTQNVMKADSFCVDMGKVQKYLNIQGAVVDPEGAVKTDTYQTTVYDSSVRPDGACQPGIYRPACSGNRWWMRPVMQCRIRIIMLIFMRWRRGRIPGSPFPA